MREIDERLLDSMLETLKELTKEVKRLSSQDAILSKDQALLLKDLQNCLEEVKAIKRRINSLSAASNDAKLKDAAEQPMRKAFFRGVEILFSTAIGAAATLFVLWVQGLI